MAPPRVPRMLDVSVPLASGVPAYPGNPEFELQPVKRIADGGSSNVSSVIMGTHTGTHVDAPQHFFDGRVPVDALELDLLIGRARCSGRAPSSSKGSTCPGMYEMYCLPLRIVGADGAPARVVLKR